MPRESPMAALDWVVLAGYAGLLVVTGLLVNRRTPATTDDYFRGGGRIPAWAAGVSIVATSMSAASFIGVPEQAYLGDLTYLSTNIGMVIASLVIAFAFVPAFFRGRVQSIYAYLGQRLGRGAGTASSAAFLAGRALASGSRIYIGALPVSMIVFGDLEPWHVVASIAVLSAVGVVYTLAGGVASVIWSDVVQMAVLLGACVAAIVVIWTRLDAGPAEILRALAHAGPDGQSKTRLFDLSFDPTATFSLPAVLIGFTLMGIGSYGADQDLAQRLLTCRDAKSGARSIIGGILFGIPSVLLFLVVGLLLFLFYHSPSLGSGPPAAPPDDSRQVFLSFILTEMPRGLSGLMIAGLFAAGLSSLNSTINAMASSFINDFYRRWRPDADEAALVRVGRRAVVAWGAVLGAFAAACVWIYAGHAQQGGTLLTFALTVMTFAYAGLLGVFFTALFTRRGNSSSAVAAIITGFVAVALMQPMFWAVLIDLDAARARGGPAVFLLDLAFVWKLTIATAVAFMVCVAGRPRVPPKPPPPLPLPPEPRTTDRQVTPAATPASPPA